MAQLYKMSQELFHGTRERRYLARMEDATWRWFEDEFGHGEACKLMQEFQREKSDHGLSKSW